MRALPFALLAFGIPAFPAPASGADFSGHWRYFERDAVEVAPRTYDHAIDFILWQRGDRVYGTWSDSAHRATRGCLKGTVKSRSLQPQLCLEEGTFGSKNGAVCPSYAPPADRFDLSRKSLVWYRFSDSSRKWEKYATLSRRNSVSKATRPKQCGADAP